MVQIPHFDKSHPAQYHQWVSMAMERIDQVAKGNSNKFLDLWQKYVKDVVAENPWILSEDWWNKYSDEWWDWWNDLELK